MKRAFTLIELIVVIAIVSLLTTITLATYVSAKNKRSVKVKAEELRNIISEARSLAISPPNIVNGNTIGPVSEVLVKIDQTVSLDSLVKIWIYCDNGAWYEYRDYSAGFNKVKFGSGSYSVVFDATSPRVGQLFVTSVNSRADLLVPSSIVTSTNPIKLTSPDGTSARYQITVNDFGFSDIVQY